MKQSQEEIIARLFCSECFTYVDALAYNFNREPIDFICPHCKSILHGKDSGFKEVKEKPDYGIN